MKHTKGPWIAYTVKGVQTSGGLCKVFAKNSPFFSLIDGVDHEEGKANAHLIAAAPDLLSACEIVLNNLTRMIPANRDLQILGEKACIDALTAAIEKAKGE